MIPSNLKGAQTLIKNISKQQFKEKIVPIVRQAEFNRLAGGGHDKHDREIVSELLNQAKLHDVECNPGAVHWYVRAITARIVCEHWHI